MANYFINDKPISITLFFTTSEFPQWNFLNFFFYNLLFFGFGEEVGWRGFLLPRLLRKTHPLTASILLTLFWALWHLPLFFYRPGYTTMDWLGILGWIISLLTGSILLTWMYRSSKGSILSCAVFHSTIDTVFTADISDKDLLNYMGFIITIWGILTILIYKSKYLSRQQKMLQTETYY